MVKSIIMLNFICSCWMKTHFVVRLHIQSKSSLKVRNELNKVMK